MPDPVLLDICELPVTSNTVVIITVCVKVANSTGFLQIKGQSGLSYRGTIYAQRLIGGDIKEDWGSGAEPR